MMISGDYSQVELRVVAHLSRDQELIEAFKRGRGHTHQDRGRRSSGCRRPRSLPTMRGIAKVVNFGIIYGMGAQALAKTTGLALEEATRFLEEHRRTYPGLYAYLDEVLAAVRERG